jgi:hypothetical protein
LAIDMARSSRWAAQAFQPKPVGGAGTPAVIDGGTVGSVREDERKLQLRSLRDLGKLILPLESAWDGENRTRGAIQAFQGLQHLRLDFEADGGVGAGDFADRLRDEFAESLRRTCDRLVDRCVEMTKGHANAWWKRTVFDHWNGRETRQFPLGDKGHLESSLLVKLVEPGGGPRAILGGLKELATATQASSSGYALKLTQGAEGTSNALEALHDALEDGAIKYRLYILDTGERGFIQLGADKRRDLLDLTATEYIEICCPSPDPIRFVVGSVVGREYGRPWAFLRMLADDSARIEVTDSERQAVDSERREVIERSVAFSWKPSPDSRKPFRFCVEIDCKGTPEQRKEVTEKLLSEGFFRKELMLPDQVLEIK